MGTAASKHEKPAFRHAGSAAGPTDQRSVSGRKVGAVAVPGKTKSSGIAEANKDAGSVPGRKSLKPSTSVIKGSDEMSDSYITSSEEVFGLFCQPCDTVGQHSMEAEGFCIDCVEYLCKTCYSSHRKPKPSRNHLLLDKNQMPKSKTPSLSQPSIQPRQDLGNTSKSNQIVLAAAQSSTRQKLRASLVDSINVHADNDQKNCFITGCVLLRSGHLVVVDRSNKSVKLIDVTEAKIISVVSLPHLPWDVTEAGSGQLAITFPGTKIIQLMSVFSTTLTRLRQIKMNGEYRHIIYNKGRLIVSAYAPVRVHVIDMQGVVLRQIDEDKIRQINEDTDGNPLHCFGLYGNELYSDWPHCLAISPDGATIYISDCGYNTVTSMTTDCLVKAEYKNYQLRHPTGLTVAPDGTVYVCGGKSSNIHQLTADLTQIQIILIEEDGLDWPQSIWYSDQDCKLYVGSGKFNKHKSKHRNSIQVFHLR